MSKGATKYVLSKDIVIPAGTPVQRASWSSRKTDFASAIIGPDKDTHFEWAMAFEDAARLGLVEERK